MSSSKSFYLQYLDIDEIVADIQSEIDNCFEPFNQYVSTLCIGQWSGDRLNYRMKILNSPDPLNKMVLCFLIDNGKTEYINKNTIKAISENLKKLNY